MLWVHGTLHRPYFNSWMLKLNRRENALCQDRAELGMTDHTGGPSSPSYVHRRRPENYEEEDELGREGGDAGVLKARSGARNDEEDERLRRQDLTFARSLRLRSRKSSPSRSIQSTLPAPPPRVGCCCQSSDVAFEEAVELSMKSLCCRSRHYNIFTHLHLHPSRRNLNKARSRRRRQSSRDHNVHFIPLLSPLLLPALPPKN
jgi:hypothetical protein